MTHKEVVLEKLLRGENLYEASECAAKIGHYQWKVEQDRLESCSQAYARIFGLTPASAMQAQDCWDGLVESMRQEIKLDDVSCSIGAGIGIVLYPEKVTSVDELVTAADKAMYRVKNSGRNNFGFAGQ